MSKAITSPRNLAIREEHEVHVSVPGRDEGNRTATGASN
jgi:hypothetical protein